MFKKQYTARWIEYNILGIKFKIKSKPEHIDTVNLVLESNYGIGNRIFAIINALILQKELIFSGIIKAG